MPSWSEATVEIDGERFTVGSLHGEPNTAFLQMAWLRSRAQFAGHCSPTPEVGPQSLEAPSRQHSALTSQLPHGFFPIALRKASPESSVPARPIQC